MGPSHQSLVSIHPGGLLGLPHLQVMFHELQHNIGLPHASMGANEYGDLSDPMGDSTGTAASFLCNNAPYSIRLGWANFTQALPEQGTPGNVTRITANLTAINFQHVQSYIVDLPSMDSTPYNTAAVNLGSPDSLVNPDTSTRYPSFYLAFRQEPAVP